jgi:Ca2+-binding RTX toxin-like protein
MEAPGGGSDQVRASATHALVAGQAIEFLRTADAGGMAAIDLTGNGADQTLVGNAGNNVLNGMGGDDVLRGLGGDDTHHVNSAGDRVVEAVGGGNDQVIASTSFGLKPGQEVELLRTANAAGMTAINLYGNEFGQTIQGNAGNTLLFGGGGDDGLEGFAGDDTYYVDSALDTVTEAAGGGALDRVFTEVSYTLQAAQQIEVLRARMPAEVTALDLTGNELGQVLQGNAGANRLDGKAGNDALKGLGGPDTFVFADGYDVDTAADYLAGTDQFDLSGVTGVDDYADLQPLMTQIGANVIINFGGGDVLRILNTTIATLDANQGDFLF